MAKIEILKPVDQAIGKRRLLDELKADLDSDCYSELRWIVAYAKAGPLHRLKSRLREWRKKSRSIRAIFGIDQQGTSKEALEIALDLCDKVYVTQERGVTFHPKAYIFTGKSKARMYLGSNNLTVGGTETNFEAAIILNAVLPTDNDVLAEMNDLWEQLLPAQCPATRQLDSHLLECLVADGHVVDEVTIRNSTKKAYKTGSSSTPMSGLSLKPPSPLPLNAKPAKKTGHKVNPAPTSAATSSVAWQAAGFAIQIVPHHNGEIFLSKKATNQNPSFFGFPFTGTTTPKTKVGNPYPQRIPDPVVNIQVYGAGGAMIFKKDAYNLNTVFYEPKSEIRITASMLVPIVPPFSVLVMTPSGIAGIDYEITIYRTDSPDYPSWEAACNQKMPSGGAGQARKFGWF